MRLPGNDEWWLGNASVNVVTALRAPARPRAAVASGAAMAVKATMVLPGGEARLEVLAAQQVPVVTVVAGGAGVLTAHSFRESGAYWQVLATSCWKVIWPRAL